MTAKYSTFTFYEPNRSKRSQKLSVHETKARPPSCVVLRITVFIFYWKLFFKNVSVTAIKAYNMKNGVFGTQKNRSY